MNHNDYISFLHVIEKLKCNTRHSWTSSGRQESVAEHSFRLAVMAMLCEDEYPNLNIKKVIKMCLIHDFGEAITGDIPSFYKTEKDEQAEETAIQQLVLMLPSVYQSEAFALFTEMREMKTPEAKLFKALDNMEAVLSHNEADISTWIPSEYKENLVYGKENAEWSEWTHQLRLRLCKDTLEKVADEA